MLKLLVGLAGAVGIAAAAAILLAGGTLYWTSVSSTDSQGFLNSRPGQVSVETHAVVSGSADINISAELPTRLGHLATLRVQARSLDASEEIFLGIADPGEIDGYLASSSYAVLEAIEFDPWEVDYELHPGQTAPRLPTLETFWEAAAYGPGTQSLTWELEDGVYALAVMNADASPGIHAELVIGGRVPLAQPAGLALLVGGSVLLTLGTTILLVALAL